MKILLGVLVVSALLLPLLFVKIYYYPRLIPVAVAAVPVMHVIDTPAGPETISFVARITSKGFSPIIIIDSIIHEPLSVNGKLVVLEQDNIQLFEYSSHEVASSEALALTTRYESSSRSKAWKSAMHVEVQDKLVIFYMGSRVNILSLMSE